MVRVHEYTQEFVETCFVSKKQRAEISRIFLEIWESLGETHRSKSDAIGISISSVSDKAHGRKLPDRHTRALMCCLVQALRDLPDDDSREDLVKRGLALMKEIEELDDA